MPDEYKLVNASQLERSLAYEAGRLRAKLGGSSTIPFDFENEKAFGDAVDSIPTGGITPSGTKQITINANGTTTEDVTNYANAEITVDVQSGGSAAGMASGSFTPAENVNSQMISVGQAYRHVLLWTTDAFTGAGVKGVGMLYFDLTDAPTSARMFGISTNNAGSSIVALLTDDIVQQTGNQRYKIAVGNSVTRFYDDETILFNGATSGTCYGLFLAGVTYHWAAW